MPVNVSLFNISLFIYVLGPTQVQANQNELSIASWLCESSQIGLNNRNYLQVCL